ncbi:MAG: hypothetical protein MUF48_22985 [Pirellulaceae bacterium]|jgi:hypothetical protein|nr:hypothetical protein [Pirellulaceae bacterium]
MKRGILMLGVLIVCTATYRATAEEPYRKWLDYFRGSWSYESSDGRTGEVMMKDAPGGYAMIATRPGPAGAVQLIGWQPDRKVIVDTTYDADGTYSVVEYGEIGERELRGKFVQFSGPHGNFAGSDVVVRIESPDVAIAVISLHDPSGDKTELTFTYRRQDKPTAAEKARTSPLPKKVRDAMEYLVGQWVAEVDLQGEKRTIHMSVKPMPDDVGYVIHWTGPGGPGAPDTVLTGIGGWDAGEEVCREMGFATNGDFFSFVYKQLSETTFEGKGSGIYQGKPMRETLFVNRTSPDTFTWTASNIVVGDQPMPDEVHYFRRVKDKK